MTGNPKKTSFDFADGHQKKGKGRYSSGHRLWTLLRHTHTLLPLVSGAIQLFIGLVLVGITILGLIEPIWFSAILSLLGCISSMTGVFLIYFTVSKQGNFEGLLNQAIRRVINSQN